MTPDEKYIQLLEKVNSQLSYSWQPMNFVIMTLSVLFTAGAIVVAFLIYYMGKDYRKSIKSILQTEIDSRDNKLKYLDKKMTNIISKYEKRLKEIEINKGKSKNEKIEQLKATLEEIKRERQTLSFSSGIGLYGSYNNPGVLNFSENCSLCGKKLPEYHIGNNCDDCKQKYDFGSLS